MNAFRFFRIASRPCQSATPRLQTASSVKQSKPLPKVLSSISFQNANSHSGGAVFVKGTVFSCVVMLLSLVWSGLLTGTFSLGPVDLLRQERYQTKKPTITANLCERELTQEEVTERRPY